MIQSPSLSALSLLPAAGDLPMAAVPEGAELADFGALLALTASQSTPVAPTAAPPQGEVPAIVDAAPDAARPGKVLPLELPLAVPVSEPEVLSRKPGNDAPAPFDLPSPRTLALSKLGIPIQRVPVEAKSLPERPAAAPAAEPELTQLDPAPPVLPVLPVLPVMAAPVIVPPLPGQVPVAEAPVLSEGEDQPRGASAPQPAPAALAHAAPPAAFLRHGIPARRGADQAAPVVAPSLQHPAPPPAAAPAQPIAPPIAPPIAQVRIELAPAPPVMRLLAKDEPRPAPSAALPELPAIPVVTTAPAASAAPVPITAQPIVLAERPQDFSALIDRLVAAREATGPHAVAVSVAHAEFGQIHLRFRHDEAGLAVSMASADPGFARAASAMPPVLPVSDPQAAQNQPGQSAARQDSAAGTGQPGTGQQRNASGERRDDQPHNNHAPRQAQPGQSQPGKPQRRAGIFA